MHLELFFNDIKVVDGRERRALWRSFIEFLFELRRGEERERRETWTAKSLDGAALKRSVKIDSDWLVPLLALFFLGREVKLFNP
jgi:hypothetical protein